VAEPARFLARGANRDAARVSLRGVVSQPLTVSSVVPFLIANVARAEGADLAQILGEAAGKPPRADEHVDVSGYFEVWRRTMAAVPRQDPSFPLRAANAFQLEDHELFGFLAMSCATLGEAYAKTASYRALYCVGARWELEVDERATRLIWLPWPGDVRDHGYRAAMDFAVADMESDIRRLGATGPRPTAVRLAHAAPADAAPFAAHYGVAPEFGSPLYELIYAPGLPELPIISFNSKLRDYFDEECRRLVGKLATGTSMVEQLKKQLILAMDGGDTSIEFVAKQLGQSSRSLQRRLSEEGTRYNDVLAEIRTEFAKRYLARGTISASEVAYLLGFTEPPAFFKAFKRWTGMTPREFQFGAAG
jgi:AraC-like DNA-binding protein